MDTHDLEKRIAQLEKQFALIEESHSNLSKHQDELMVECERRTQALEPRFQDLDGVEKLAFDAYIETHQRAQDAVLDVDRLVSLDLSPSVYFKNIPSVKDQRDRRDRSKS